MKVRLKSWLYRNNKQAIKKTLCALAGGFMALGVVAQTNLVPNPSFETYSNCPTADGQLFYAIPWYPMIHNAGYLNACSSAANVPGCCGYFQYAKTGVAYAIIWSIDYYGLNYRDYIQAQLLDTLKAGKCYYVEFYQNLANWAQFGVNNMAAHFSTDSVKTTNTGGILTLTPQVMIYGNPVITDTLNWVKVSGIYTAQGGEHFITIGNFFNDAHSDTTNIINPNGYQGAAYYIDDVSVTEINSSFTPTWSYRDTTIIKGDSVYIGTRTGGLNCTWHKGGQQIATGVPGLYVKPTGTTTYTVTETLPCASSEGTTRNDTVVVTVKTLGVAEINSFAGFKLYPNPVTDGILHIDGIKNAYTIEFYNLPGEKILQTKATETVDLSNLSNGVYFIRITNAATNESTLKKLVIQK